MLATEDIEELFGIMRTAYGGQWKHAGGAVKVWRSALSRFSTEDIRHAANESMRHYVNHPPTLPQFLNLVKPPTRANTYLPAPTMTRAQTTANLVMAAVVRRHRGPDKKILRNMVALKNALLEEHADENPTEAFLEDLETQLDALASRRDPDVVAIEREDNRRRFCVTRGVPYRHISEYVS